MRVALVLALFTVTACAGDAPVGPYVAGTAAFTATDDARERSLHAQIWYPAAESGRSDADAGFPIEQFGFGDEVATLTGLLATARDPGTLRTAHAAVDAPLADGGPWPVVMFSHCMNCTRFSTFQIAERLASHGYAVIAPDHAGGTLYDELAGDSAPLGADFLNVRAADVSFLLDEALDAGTTALPEALRGKLDATRVGVFGHSFGGITTGRVLMLDDRPKSGLSFGAPMENPLTPGVTLADLHVPIAFVVATEDNSITEVGNITIRNNYASANPPVTKLEVTDAGHWSFTTICGLTSSFDPGCDPNATRQTDGAPFTYADIDAVRDLSASWATAWFAATLDDDADARAWLLGPHDGATVETRAE